MHLGSFPAYSIGGGKPCRIYHISDINAYLGSISCMFSLFRSVPLCECSELQHLDRNKKKSLKPPSCLPAWTLTSLTPRLLKILKTGQLKGLGMSLKCITERVCGLTQWHTLTSFVLIIAVLWYWDPLCRLHSTGGSSLANCLTRKTSSSMPAQSILWVGNNIMHAMIALLLQASSCTVCCMNNWCLLQ